MHLMIIIEFSFKYRVKIDKITKKNQQIDNHNRRF